MYYPGKEKEARYQISIDSPLSIKIHIPLAWHLQVDVINCITETGRYKHLELYHIFM